MRCYVFDVDHNLSTIDKLVFMEKDGVHFDVPSKHATYKRLEEGYIWRNNDWIKANSNFRDDWPLWDDTFSLYIQETIDTQSFWPSFPMFKEALLEASPIWIITARGHANQNIKRGIFLLIQSIYTPEEKQELLGNIQKYRSDKTSFEDALHEYLDHQYFVWWASDEFFARHINAAIMDWYERKTVAMEEFVQHVMILKDTYFQDDKNISIWFSDDEKPNINAMKARWEKNLALFEKNNIHFVCYDTSDTPETYRVTIKISD